MKHIIFALWVCLAIPAAATPAQPALSWAATRAVADKQQVSLATHITQQLQAYYQRTDFKDPDHQTGWYRVDDFLTWLNDNESSLTNDLQQPILEPYSSQTIWVYLGARYIADRYGVVLNASLLKVHAYDTQEGNSVQLQETTILVDPSSHRTPPAAITLGMHEGAHLLPAIAQDPQPKTLCELASFYAQHQYGLPVKIEDAKWFSYGVRNILLTANRKSYALVPLTREYALHVVGLVILPELSPTRLLNNYNSVTTAQADITIATAIVRWHALTQQQLVAGEEIYSPVNFLENLLGPLAQHKAIYDKTYQFFRTVDPLLPPALKERLHACLPININQPSACTRQLEEWIDHNPQLLLPALKQALAQSNPPAVPHGYL